MSNFVTNLTGACISVPQRDGTIIISAPQRDGTIIIIAPGETAEAETASHKMRRWCETQDKFYKWW